MGDDEAKHPRKLEPGWTDGANTRLLGPTHSTGQGPSSTRPAPRAGHPESPEPQ